MENLLLMTLTDKIENKKNYLYFYNDKIFNEKKDQYYTTIYLENFNINNIICIGTLQSSWDYLYEEVYSYFGEINSEDVTLIKDIIKKENKPTEEKISDFFKKKTNNRINILILDEDSNLKEITTKILEMGNILKVFEEIYIDIIGGLRVQSIAVLQLINYLRNNNDISRKMNFIAQFTDINKKESEIFLDNEIFNRIEKVNKINSFIKYGDPKGIEFIAEEYNENKGFIEMLEKVFLSQQLNLIDSFEKNLNITKKQKVKHNEYIVYNSIEKVIREWIKIASNKNEFYKFLNLIIEMNYNKGNIGIAYNNVDRLFLKEEVKKIYNITSEDKNKMKNVRNKILHSYNRKQKINYIDVTDELRRFCNKYNIFKKYGTNEVLIWNLGIGEDKSYKQTKYEYNNKKYNTKFSIEVYLKHNDNFNEIYILGTETSIWKELFDTLKQIYKPNEKIEFGFKNQDELNKMFSTLNSKIKCVFIPKGENKKESVEIFKVIDNEIMNSLSNNGMFNNITYDLTHIFRTTSIYVLNAIHYFESLYYNISVMNITYGKLGIGESNSKIISSKDIIDVMRQHKIIDIFKKYNKYDSKTKNNLVETKYILEFMIKLSNSFVLNDIASFNELRKSFFEHKPKPKNNIEIKIVEILKDIFGKRELNSEIQFIRKQFETNNIAFALYNIRDYYYYDIFKMKFIGNNDEDRTKETVESISKYITEKAGDSKIYYKFLKIDKDIVDLREIRNISGHSSGKSIKLSLNEIKEKISDIILFFEENIDEIKKIAKNWR